MGISVSSIDCLIELQKAGYLAPGGAVAEIGAQQLHSSCLAHPDRMAQLGRLFGVDLPLSLPELDSASAPHEGAQVLDFSAPFARDFWRWLGFEYAAIDIDGSPDSIPLDLNYDSAPAQAKGKYHLVTNFGTTEHIANQFNAFNVIHDLTALNGIMIHEVPTQGMFNHGLVNYNFKFFWLLIRSNGYKVIHSDFMAAHDYANLPDNILEFLAAVNLTGSRRSYDHKAADAGMVVVLQKVFDIPFVAPLDVDTGASTEIEVLKKRYWTVFEQDPFDRFLPNGKAHSDAVSVPPSSAATAAAKAVRQIPLTTPQGSPSEATKRRSANAGAALDAASMSSVHKRRFGVVMKPWRTLRRMVSNSDQIPPIVHQSVLLNQKADAIVQGIANHSDLMRRNLEALLRVMTELRDIQKAQLFMQRKAAEALKQSTMPAPESSPAKRPGAN